MLREALLTRLPKISNSTLPPPLTLLYLFLALPPPAIISCIYLFLSVSSLCHKAKAVTIYFITCPRGLQYAGVQLTLKKLLVEGLSHVMSK